jgi:serine/threonine-protein kinase
MKPEEWNEIDELFQEALKEAPGDRGAFLDRACDGREVMRREVESLLTHHEQAQTFLEQPPTQIAAEFLTSRKSRFRNGQFIDHYRVVECLGVGGMGEVYLAQDSRLNRRVAIKILPDHFTSDSGKVRRFDQEARAASTLNHPNIVTIHQVGQVDGVHFIVAEYIEGQTLRQRLTRGAMDLGEALEVAVQVANALVAAHAAGIVHRDIKPDNIMLRPDGLIKVLDFGLAKLSEPTTFASHDKNIDSRGLKTSPGVVMGTVRYMSPEQAMGKPVDARTDTWSLGVVLFEMLAGKLPFDGETPSHVIVEILDQPARPMAAHVNGIPPGLERVVHKSLCKNIDERYQTANEFADDLKNLRAQLKDYHPGRKSIDRWKRSALAVAAALVLAVGIFLFLAKPHKPIDSLAVLPFVNGGDGTTEYLSDGVSEVLVNSLSQIHDLKISPRSVVSQYKDASVDPSAIGRELGVRAVLTGRVASHGEDLDMQVDLLDAKNGSRLWRKTYQRPLSNLLGVQKEIVAAVASTLGVQRAAAKSGTNSSEAYQLYLQGRYYGQKQNAEGIRKMGEYFNKAITIDPDYALAYAGLADYWRNRAAGGTSGAEYWPKSEEAAVKAITLDESIGEAHEALANVRMWYDHNWRGTESELKRAIELNPEFAETYTFYARLLEAMGRFDEAVAAAKRSSEVDPHSWHARRLGFGEIYFFARRYDLAVEEFRKSIANDSGYELPHLGLAEVYVQQQKFTEALAEARIARLLIQNPGQLARLGAIFAAAGDRKEATEILVEVQGVSTKRVKYFTACIYAVLGNSNEAIAWLTKAVDEFDTNVIDLKVDPRFDSLRQDARFTALLGRMHLLQ